MVVVEDELGLSNNGVAEDNDTNNGNEFQSALDYIRAMVRTTLPPISNSDDNNSQQVSYMDASPWQRARVQLPRAWLHGVRLQELDTNQLSSAYKSQTKKDHDDDGDDSMDTIGRIPIQFILECSVDDGTEMLEIPLLAIPPTTDESMTSLQLQQQVNVSNEILQELSQNYNGETTASFMSLALFHRYNKSGEGSVDSTSPTLKVSDGLLHRLKELQQQQQKEDQTRYCWVVSPASTNKDDDNVVDNDIDTVIQNTDLPLYRTLSQVQEEDQRVLQHLKQQNFGKNPTTSSSGDGSDNSNSDGSGTSSNSDSQQEQQRKKNTDIGTTSHETNTKIGMENCHATRGQGSARKDQSGNGRFGEEGDGK